jgi:hypothetical protein
VFTRPATESFYLVAGRTVLIKTYDDWISQAIAKTIDGWFLTPSSQKLEADLTLKFRSGVTSRLMPDGLTRFSIPGGVCATDNEEFYVEFGKSLIVFGPGLSKEVDIWVDEPMEVSGRVIGQLLSYAFAPALRRCGVFEIHSAGVVAPGSDKAILIAGPSGSGKSTLTTQLANCNWGYLSDDVLWLHESEEEVRVQPLRRFFALTSETLAAINLTTTKVGEPNAKTRLEPEELFQTQAIIGATPGTILFTTVGNENRTQLQPLTAAQSMTRLLRLSPWAAYDKPTSGQHLQVLGRLANSTTAFDLIAGKDILINSTSAAEIVEQVVSETALVH